MTGAAMRLAARQLFRLPQPVYWMSAAAFFASLSTMAMKFLALYLAYSFDYSIEEIGRVLMVYGLGAIIGAFGGGFAVLPLSAATWFAVTTMIVWTLGEILLWPMLMKLAMRAAEHKSGGTYLGAYHSIFSISQIASPLLGTWIYSALGGDALWLICGGLSILAVAILWTLDLGHEPATPLVSLEKARK